MTYKKILDFINGKDAVTCKIVLEILEEEITHEQDLEAILADMTTPVK
jgi:ferritin-like protein